MTDFIKENRKIFIAGITLILLFSIFLFPNNADAQQGVIGQVLGGGGGTALYCSGLMNEVGGFVQKGLKNVLTKGINAALGAFGLPGLPGGGGLTEPVEVVDKDRRTKEECLDHLAFVAANALIENALRDTVDWINGNSGDGGPRFVQDVGGFLGQTADEVVGEFIHGSAFGFVCDPFRANLRVSLARLHIPNKQVQCTLSGVTSNVKNFIEGDFYDGGWNAWGELVTRSNPYTQFLKAESELALEIQGRQNIELAKLQWGSGFFAWETCPNERYICEGTGLSEATASSYITDKDGEATCKASGGNFRCAAGTKTNTPGSVINEQLNNVLSSGQRRLEVADELNEVVSALLNKLITDIFSKDGLSGYNPNKRTNTLQELAVSSANNSGVSGLCREYGICENTDSGTATPLAGPNDITLSYTAEGPTVFLTVNVPNYPAAGTPAWNASAITIFVNDQPIIQTVSNKSRPMTCDHSPCVYANNYENGSYTYRAELHEPNTGNIVKVGPATFVVPTNSSKPSAPKPTNYCGIGNNGGGGGGACGAPGAPPNELSTVQQFSHLVGSSCGDWTFMDAVVKALHAKDPNWGYNGKRGNTSDPSEDAIAYYYGGGTPVNGDNNVYVVDIIGSHCGGSPSVGWLDQTTATCQAGTVGAYLYPRTGGSGGTTVPGNSSGANACVQPPSPVPSPFSPPNNPIPPKTLPTAWNPGGGPTSPIPPSPEPSPEPSPSDMVITSISPNPVQAGAVLTINGTNLVGTVQFFDSSGQRDTRVGTINSNETQVTITIPSSFTTGQYTLRVGLNLTDVSNTVSLDVVGGSNGEQPPLPGTLLGIRDLNGAGIFPDAVWFNGELWVVVDDRANNKIDLWASSNTDLSDLSIRKTLNLGSQAGYFPRIDVYNNALWVIFRDNSGSVENVKIWRSDTDSITTVFNANSGGNDPVAIGHGYIAWQDANFNIFRQNMDQIGTLNYINYGPGAPTGISRILPDGNIRTIDQDRFIFSGYTRPWLTGIITMAEGVDDGVVYNFVDDPTIRVLWDGQTTFTPHGSFDGNNLYGIVTWSPTGGGNTVIRTAIIRHP